MPVEQNANENLNASNEAANNELITITSMFQKQRELKEELEKNKAKDREDWLKELTKEAQPAWEKYDQKMGDINHITHKNYDVPWGRLMDLLMVLNDALIKERPIFQAQWLTPCTSFITNGALWATGSVVGGLVGGANSLFGAGDGMMAGAKRGSDYLLNNPNDELQYFVEMRDEGTLEYWLKRSDGKELSLDEQMGYVQDISNWLEISGFKANPDPEYVGTFVDSNNNRLTPDNFVNLRDHEQHGLRTYFKARQLEVKQSLDLMNTKELEVEEHSPAPRMGMS